MDSIEVLIENIKNYIELMLVVNINYIIDKQIDITNFIINSLFNNTKDKRLILLRVIFVFLMLYTEFINKSLEEETNAIYSYLQNRDISTYKINYKILDSIYVVISSLIEADLKDKSTNFVKLYDRLLTKNIKILQEDERVDYDPYKTPVICNILFIAIPLFNSIGLYKKLNDDNI